MSLNTKFAIGNNRPSGFDYLRLGLAVSIVCMHSVQTSYGLAAETALWTSPLRGLLRLILPMFFALSGFLVAGSLQRTTTLLQFLGLRAIRIYPALAVEVILSALLLGPLITTVPLSVYYKSSVFWNYLLNVTGHIHYLLPGVFHNNPFPDIVNVQLWTVPFELLCYISLSVLSVLGLKRWIWLAPAATVIAMLAYPVKRFLKYHGSLTIVDVLPGLSLVICFLCGVTIFFYRDKIPWSKTLLVVSGIVAIILVGFAPFGEYVVAPVAAYFTIAFGVTNPRKLYILRGADYSYGIFLYGFAIQQTLMATLPWARVWWANILLAVPLTTCVAAFSWHVIEKPALRLRRYLVPKSDRRKHAAGIALGDARLPAAD